jgi:hypothetical protein
MGPKRQEERRETMVTNYPHPMAAHNGLRTTSGSERPGVFARLLALMSQLACGFRGHDSLLQFEDERISLRCASCGHETPGWELNEARPTITVRAEPRRQSMGLPRPQLISTRRIA